MEKISAGQMDYLYYMIEHSGLATKRLNCANGKELSRRMWERLTRALNTIGLSIRDTKKWKKVCVTIYLDIIVSNVECVHSQTWTDYTYNLRERQRKLSEHSLGTGGGAAESTISDQQLQIMALLSIETCVDGVAGDTDGFYEPVSDACFICYLI